MYLEMIEEAGRNCMKCGFCRASCPLFDGVETNSPRAKVRMSRAVVRGEMEAGDWYWDRVSMCLNCKTCSAECPAGVEVDRVILAARADDIRTNALAGAQAVTLLDRANADRLAREGGALAQAALFTNQIPALQAAPAVYAERAYLQTFARATANARKYVLLTTNTQDVLQFDLKHEAYENLLNLSVPAPKTP